MRNAKYSEIEKKQPGGRHVWGVLQMEGRKQKFQAVGNGDGARRWCMNRQTPQRFPIASIHSQAQMGMGMGMGMDFGRPVSVTLMIVRSRPQGSGLRRRDLVAVLIGGTTTSSLRGRLGAGSPQAAIHVPAPFLSSTWILCARQLFSLGIRRMSAFRLPRGRHP